LAEHETLTGLLDNGWLSLAVVDPRQDHRAFRYAGDLEWTPIGDRRESPRSRPSPAPAADE
ncbi:MAG: hypothetical protein ABEN55_10665, partial [Bradymonadaceae bacterium]